MYKTKGYKFYSLHILQTCKNNNNNGKDTKSPEVIFYFYKAFVVKR